MCGCVIVRMCRCVEAHVCVTFWCECVFGSVEALMRGLGLEVWCYSVGGAWMVGNVVGQILGFLCTWLDVTFHCVLTCRHVDMWRC